MPVMPRPKGKPTQIAYNLLGKPFDTKYKKTKKEDQQEVQDFNYNDIGRSNDGKS